MIWYYQGSWSWAGLWRVCVNRHDFTVAVACMDGSVAIIRINELWNM